MRHSPLAKTPPANLPVIPGVTVPKDGSNSNDSSKNHENGHNDHGHKLQTVTGNFTKKKSWKKSLIFLKTLFFFLESAKEDEEAQFDMDI